VQERRLKVVSLDVLLHLAVAMHLSQVNIESFSALSYAHNRNMKPKLLLV
jgi:hypothetical protein